MAAVRYFVSDVHRAVEYYTDRLGFRLERQVGSSIAEVSYGDLSLYLSGPKASAADPLPDGRRPEPGGWNRILIEVEDLSARVAALTRAGVPLRGGVVETPAGKKALVEDLDGNLVELLEPAPAEA